MESIPPKSMPDTLPISSDSKDSVAEEVPAEERVTEVVGVAISLPTSLTVDCSSSAEMQRLPAPVCPTLVSETQIDCAVQELQLGSQTDKEKIHPNSESKQIQPPEEGAGLVVFVHSKEKQPVRLECKPETGTKLELVGKEQTRGDIAPKPLYQISFAGSSSIVPKSEVGFKLQDGTEHGAMEQCDSDSLFQANQGSHIPPSNADGQQHSKPTLLPSPSTDISEIKESDPSKTQPQIIENISNAPERQTTDALESAGTFECVKASLETSSRETQLPSAEILDTSETRETLHGLYTSGGASSVSSNTARGEDGNVQVSCDPVDGEQVQSSTKEEQTEAATSSTDFTVLPECSSTQDSSSQASAAPPVFDTDTIMSLQAGQVVEAETSHHSDQIPAATMPLVAELADGREIVVVREEAHICEDWSNLHLTQSYLVQQEDGSVCEAAIVNELSSTPKLYEGGLQSEVDLHSQPVEVYEFCGLVEEVAEETVCASSSVQISDSTAYEVNLFNALLENSGEYTVKQDLMHLGPSIHTINDNDTVIISQQSLSSTHDAHQIQALNNSNELSSQNIGVAALGQHLVLDANQAVQVATTTEVCLVEVDAVTADLFTVQQAGTSAQCVKTCSQVNSGLLDQTGVSYSFKIQSAPQKQEAEATAGSLSLISDTGMQPSVAVSVHVSHVQNQPPLIQTPGVSVVSATKLEACVPTHGGTKKTPALKEIESHTIKNVVPTDTKLPTTHPSSSTNPKLLLLNPGETPLLKNRPSHLAQSSTPQNVAVKLANAQSSLSGTVSECLPRTVSAADSLRASTVLSSQKDQTQCSVNKNSVTHAPSVKVQQPTMRDNLTFQLDQAAFVTPASKSVKDALTATTVSTSEAASRDTSHVATPSICHIPDAHEVSMESEDAASTSPHDPASQLDSLYVEDESEDMDQDEPIGEAETHEVTSGQVSSPEEDSDEEQVTDKSEITTPSSPHKVRQWNSERVTMNSSPVSPSTSSSYMGPSPNCDWSTARREKSSPLRGPHGKFVSPAALGGFNSSSISSDQSTPQRPRGERHTDMAELAKHEADIEHRTQSLKREGFWSMKRLTRLTEPVRPKVQWDYLCEEMQWLSADFAQERRWKRGVARKVVRMVMRHHEELRQKEEKAKRDEHAKIRRVASSIAKEVRAFWSSVEKVVQYKQQSRLEEKRKKALDLQLDFIVGQTEKYSDLLSKSLAPTRPAEAVPQTTQKTLPPPADEDDRDFEPPCEEEDDEETIEVEEQQEGNDAESHQREIELLKEEGMLPLDQLLSTLKLPQDLGSEEESSDETSSSVEEEDREFHANEEDAEDEEDTIAAQEKVEGNVDHTEELDDLAKEGDMTVEQLLEKYKGAYASDFEAPSASGSKATSDSEVSGDEEVETEEDESDVESNPSSTDSQGDSAADVESEKDEEEEEDKEEEDEDCGDEGMELLLKEGDHTPPSSGARPKKEISHFAATAESLQPKGYTLATTKVKTPIPFLLHGTLREYQHIGLDWLVTMYEKKLNGILADEMGLGKTIQTIALLAHLACEKGNWGPHLIIVPTSVMLNWEMELKRWCPGFKILTYFGSQKERKLKRQGWTKPNAFHVCITSYKLVLQDHQAFRRKSWRYLILDEAQNIKNFKSQRWQSLLNFNSHRRLLLTGTPLQNSLMELWSLMHFLMPHVFQSHREFKEWFSNPLTGMIEGSQEYNEGLVKRLHKVLRPFLLRRIKVDVEKQMPKKYEHVVRCRLSKRQRFLYDDFMAQASTRETLASGHFMSVINILMQLRKVCNHPNLFDPRPIQSPFITKPIVFCTASLVLDALEVSPLKRCDLSTFDLVGVESRVSRYQADVFLPRHKVGRQLIQEIVESPEPSPRPKPVRMKVNRTFQPPPKGDTRPFLLVNKPTCSVPPATQTPKPTPAPEVSSTPAPAPVVQQVVCSVASAPPPRPCMHPPAQAEVRSTVPKPVLTVRPPSVPCTATIPAHPSPNAGSIMPQRVLLSPDMQARLPSGEVVSIAQLASLAGRPMSSCQGSKPVTFQLQGNKLTLSGAQIHQVPAASPRPVQGNVMHLVSSGVQHHLITQPAHVAVQSPGNTNHANPSSAAPPVNRLPHTAIAQVPSSMVSSPGVVKIVVRQSAGKEGGPVPTLAVAPSPRVAPQASPSLHPHANTTPVRNTAPLQIAQRTPGPATAHYTIAPPRIPSSTPTQSQPPRPILKVVQPPPSSTEKPAPAPATPSSSVPKSSTTPRDNNSGQAPVIMKSKPSVGARSYPPPRRVPRPPPRSPFYMSWLAASQKQQHDSRLDFIFRVNEQHCGAKPVYGREVLDFLTFLPGPHPAPAALGPQGQWGRSGHSSCLFAQWQDQCDYWFQSHRLREAIHSIEERLEMLSAIVDRFTFAIPPVEAPQISMHCCHPPPSLSHKQTVFSSLLSTEVAPRTRSLHRIHCNMRTQFPDLRLIQYDCGKLQTLHTLLRKLKTGGHRVLIFTQMTRMLDVLEQFLNYHGHIYLRLDGSTRVEMRQSLMERFNADRRIFCFILSTRSGGVGVNLTGADTVVFYDSDWNPTMDAQAQDRCHRIGQTRDVHIYRLISERTVEENILKKANQKRMLGDMAIEGGNFTTAFFKEQTIRELFDVNEGEKQEVAVELSVPQPEEEETVHKQSTTILEQALCRAEDEEDIVAASQAKAEQVAELAEFNENIPLDDGVEQEEVEELSKAEQEIAALVEQLTPIERYAMNFLEASLEDVCKEELKQAEEQVEAARKGLDQAKEEGLKLHASSDDEDDDFLSLPTSVEPAQPTPARRGRKPKDKDKIVTSTRTSGRLRGASPETEPEPTTLREVPERLRLGLRGRGAAKDTGTVSTTPSRTDHPKSSSSTRLQDSAKSSKASSPARDNHPTKTRTLPNRSHPSPVPSPPAVSPPGGKQLCAVETDNTSPKAAREEKEGEEERGVSESSLVSSCPTDPQTKDDESKEVNIMSPPSTSSRSPRKRQSADGEVLRGLVEDSPSAKVLRKLPGRLVTVVEEKEPKRRRRRGSGTGGGGSSEEAAVEETTIGLVEEPNKDNTSPSPDIKTKGTSSKSPNDQDSAPNPSVHPQPVRAYPPYSPPHLSPDMPVLRNLPVRRRLETESRMAAQLVEQQQHLGRGRGGNHSKKTDSLLGKDPTSTSTESGVNSLATPLKRKRGRPPKTPLRLPEPDNTASHSPQPTSPSEEGNPPLSPKRKRGRPRKDSTTTPESEEHNAKKGAATTDASGLSKSDSSAELTAASPQRPDISVSQACQSILPDGTDTNADVPAADPNQGHASTTKIKASAPPALQATAPLHAAASESASTHFSSAPSVSFPTSATAPVTAVPSTATSLPPASTVSSPLPGVKPKLVASTAPVGPTPEASLTMEAGPDTAKTTTLSTPPTEPSVAAVMAVPTPVPATAATTIISKTENLTPAVTTTVKPVTTTTTASEDTLSTALPAPTPTSCPAFSLTSPATSPPNPASVSSPSNDTAMTTTTAETSRACPSNSGTTMTTDSVKMVQESLIDPTCATAVPATCPANSDHASPAPPVTTVDISSANTAPTSPTQTKTNVTKPVQAVQEATQAKLTTDKVASPATSPAAHGPACTPSPTTSTNVANTTAEKVATVKQLPPTEDVQVTTTAEVTSSKEPTPTAATTSTPAEKAVRITPPVTTSTETSQASQPVPKPTSSPEKSVVVASTNTVAAAQVHTSTASPLPVAETMAASTNTTPPVSISQTSTAISPQVQEQNPASKVDTSSETTPAQGEDLPESLTSVPSSVLSEKQSTEPKQNLPATQSDSVTEAEEDSEARTSNEVDEREQEICESPSKRTKLESSSGSEGVGADAKVKSTCQKEENVNQQAAEEPTEDQTPPKQKRSLSRQSSQDSTRSSSPSSGGSTSTLTRHAHHKRTYENRHPAKRRRVDDTSEGGNEETMAEGEDKDKLEEGSQKVPGSTASQRRHSRSSSSCSSSSDTDDEGGEEHRLTRSAKRRLQDQEEEKGTGRSGKSSAPTPDRIAANNANASTGGESGSDTSSVKTTRKCAGSQPPQDAKAQTNSAPVVSPEPEVLGKRCSALNAAAKLLAMKGRVDTPGHTTRKDSAARATGTSTASSSDKNPKAKNKSVPASLQSNPPTLPNNRIAGSKHSTTPNLTSRSASRSTRQCPGSLVPPLDLEYKRSKPEEKERGSMKSSKGREGEAEAQSSSRGHSACSSMSSDGEGEGGGGRSSRSRSSSNSSRRTHSISSQNTRSRAASSGSERDRSSDRAKRRDAADKQGQWRESHKESRRSQRLSQEVTSSPGAEGTPDRVLRSVAALAAVQARSPAASTRSSSSSSSSIQNRHNKT